MKWNLIFRGRHLVICVGVDMFAIKDKNSAGRIMLWVKKEPTFLPKHEYVFISDDEYLKLKNATFWITDTGKFIFEKPYTFTYHKLEDDMWKLDHDKTAEFIKYAQGIFYENIKRYAQYGLEQKKVEFLLKQIDLIETLDDMEEFSLIYLGGKYEVVYNHKFNVRV